MAQFSAIVCLPPQARSNVDVALESALAPYRIAEGPEETWMLDDWWIRESDHSGLPVLAGHDSDPRLVHRTTRWDGSPLPPPLPGRCGGGPRELIDFATPLAEAERNAEASWSILAELAAAHPPAEPLSAFEARSLADPDGYPYARCLADYQAQPFVRAHAELQGRFAVPFSQSADPFIWVEDPVLQLAGGQAAYLSKSTVHIIVTEALLTLDGRWLDQDGGSGYAEAPPPPDPKLSWRDLYAIEATDYLLGVPGDTLLISIGCHC
ncbi:hypothetical protein [Streptodolium elevatio]|uniref:Uncharacterized protein n=1 Tax=Streptodolium elevatio TaxID=3157996 RepID=A0ABV3DGR7_9ACTN